MTTHFFSGLGSGSNFLIHFLHRDLQKFLSKEFKAMNQTASSNNLLFEAKKVFDNLKNKAKVQNY